VFKPLSIWLALVAAQASMLVADTRPNIVFFIADDMLPRHFNVLPEGEGRNLTPNLDRLAREGTLLTEGHVASPVCTPSRYNVLTGNFASRANNLSFLNRTKRHGQSVVDFNSHIIATDVTLPKLLQQAGYTTGMVGKNHVVEVAGLHNFTDFNADVRNAVIADRLRANHEKVRKGMRAAGFDFADRIYHNNPNFLGIRDVAVQNMEWITEGGVNFIGQDHHQPFFLYFATTVPHGPTDADRSWNADPLMSAVGVLDAAPDVQPARATIPTRLQKAGLPVDEHTANLLWLDDALGALLDKLESTRQLDNTIIFFFSDHGQMAKGTVYQGGVHNPSIVWQAGGFPVGAKTDSLIHIVDFAPTILEMAGIDTTDVTFDGESFLPYLNGDTQQPGRALYFELGYSRGIRIGDWKYIAVRYPDDLANMTPDERRTTLETYNADRRFRMADIVTEDPTEPFSHFSAVPGGTVTEATSTGAYPAYYDADQLYHLANDPDERRNLAGEAAYADELTELQHALQEIIDTLPGQFKL
jgi:arylsulfatase A